MRCTVKIQTVVLLVLSVGTLALGQVYDERITKAQAYLALMLASQFSEGVESTLINSGVAPQDLAITIEDYFEAYAGCYIASLEVIDDIRTTGILAALADGSAEDHIHQLMRADEGVQDSEEFLEELRFDLRECGLRIHQEFGIPVR